MIDTHTHLYMTDFYPNGGGESVCRAMEAGVEMMVLPAVDRESIRPMLELHARYPKNTALALGLHPTEVEADWREELAEILASAPADDVVAIGEVGVDLHYGSESLTRQMDAFGYQIQTALDLGLPVIVHSRDAFRETAEAVRAFEREMPPIVFHSFTAGPHEMELLAKYAPEAYFGINGVVTFKNAEPLRESLRILPMERIVTETDAPFLAPVPHRGQTNESAYIPLIVKKISEVKELEEEQARAATVENALRLFPRLRPKLSN